MNDKHTNDKKDSITHIHTQTLTSTFTNRWRTFKNTSQMHSNNIIDEVMWFVWIHRSHWSNITGTQWFIILLLSSNAHFFALSYSFSLSLLLSHFFAFRCSLSPSICWSLDTNFHRPLEEKSNVSICVLYQRERKIKWLMKKVEKFVVRPVIFVWKMSKIGLVLEMRNETC